MKITDAKFLQSVSEGSLPDFGTEIAVVGRSNVGKSSFINFITDHGKLARTSSTPGRTRLINYFSINQGEFTLVDLPGYGYARVSFDEKEKWGRIIDNYLKNSTSLKHVLIITDIRVDNSPLDKQMLSYLVHYSIPFTVIANKADKVPKSKVFAYKNKIASTFGVGTSNVIAVSSTEKKGKEEVMKRLEQILTVVDEFE